MNKKILLIYTGGTIGMIKDQKKNTLVPFNFDQLWFKSMLDEIINK